MFLAKPQTFPSVVNIQEDLSNLEQHNGAMYLQRTEKLPENSLSSSTLLGNII